MIFEHNEKSYEVRDITRAERRKVAALYLGALRHSDDGVGFDGARAHELFELAFRLSGLTEETLMALSPMDENALLLHLVQEYSQGLSGKGSGA